MAARCPFQNNAAEDQQASTHTQRYFGVDIQSQTIFKIPETTNPRGQLNLISLKTIGF